jgi:hypothetical protein
MGRVGGQGKGIDRAEKEPRSVAAADEIGVLALPPDPGGSAQRFFHDRGGIDEDFDFRPGTSATSQRASALSARFTTS